MPLWGVTLFIWLWRQPLRREGRRALWIFMSAQACVPVALMLLALWIGNDDVVQNRLNTWHGNSVLLNSDDDQSFDFEHYRRTVLQNWQMLAYAAKGSTAPWGYGRAPLSNVGMSYASSMSDSAFAIYVLGE